MVACRFGLRFGVHLSLETKQGRETSVTLPKARKSGHNMTDQAWQDGTWETADGLTLHYRDYAGDPARLPLLCIPGLTRNARDFEPVAERFAGERRVICVNLRGRGDSEYAKDSASYAPATYLQDLSALFEQARLSSVVGIGTSLGGILFAMMGAQNPERLAGIVFNDIGPVIEQTGLDRIREYVGSGRSFPTWMHAARHLRETMLDVHPDFTISEWLRLTKRLMVVGSSGRIVYDYDMRVADPMDDADPETPIPDMWPVYTALPPVPKLVIRGELSDILGEPTMAEMTSRIPDCESVTIARTGHVPTLDEDEALAAIARLLERAA